MNLRHLLMLLLVAIAAAGCTSTRKGTTADNGQIPVTVAPDAAPVAAYRALTAAYSDWHDVQIPVKASLLAPSRISASGRLTMVRDSLIHISLRVLGIEMAVARATADSAWVVDKFHRTVHAVGMDALKTRTGLTLSDLQALLLGRACSPGRGTATPAMAALFSLASESGSALSLAPARPAAAYKWSMTAARLSDGRMALTAIDVDGGDFASAKCTFTPYASLVPPAGAVASAIDASARLGKKSVQARLTYTLPEARWNTDAAPAAPSLRGYSRR